MTEAEYKAATANELAAYEQAKSQLFRAHNARMLALAEAYLSERGPYPQQGDSFTDGHGTIKIEGRNVCDISLIPDLSFYGPCAKTGKRRFAFWKNRVTE